MSRRMREELILVADAFAAAALDAAQWLPALRKLADLTGSTRAQLIGIGADAHTPFNYITDFSARDHSAFDAAAGYRPSVNPRVAAAVTAAPMTVIWEADYDAIIPTLSSVTAVELNHALDIPFGCQTSLMRDARGEIGLAVLRTARDGRSSPRQRALFASAAIAARMAAQTQLALDHQGAQLIAGAFEAVTAAAFLCSARGHVVARTCAAEALLSAGRLRISDQGLTAPHPDDAARLAAAIASARSDRPAAGAGGVVLRPPSPDDVPLVLHVAPLARHHRGLGLSAEVVVLVRGSGRGESERNAILRAAYDLTPAEAAVAAAMLAGQDRRGIASQRGVSEATVHAQLKTIFLKTGARREADLVARLSLLLGG